MFTEGGVLIVLFTPLSYMYIKYIVKSASINIVQELCKLLNENDRTLANV